MDNIGEKLKNARKVLGLTQEEVANKLNISRNTLSNIENGNRSILVSELEEFAKLYKITYTDLLNDKDLYPKLFINGFNLLTKIEKEEIIDLIGLKNKKKKINNKFLF